MEKHELPGGGMFASGTWEELQELMARNEYTANTELWPEQKNMLETKGDQYFLNIQPGLDFAIFGEAWSVETSDRSELKSYGVKSVEELSTGDNGDREAYDYTCKALRASRERGYIFGQAYSIVCPDGELGSTHVSQMWPISKEAFEEARTLNWKLDKPKEFPLLCEAIVAYGRRANAK